MNPKKIEIQLKVWLLGMMVNFLIDGNVLIGGLIGATVGFLIVLNYHPNAKV